MGFDEKTGQRFRTDTVTESRRLNRENGAVKGRTGKLRQESVTEIG